jgi:hypothetical protein
MSTHELQVAITRFVILTDAIKRGDQASIVREQQNLKAHGFDVTLRPGDGEIRLPTTPRRGRRAQE